MTSQRPIDAILELARWAPSGDNTQPWRFEIVDDSHVVVHGSDTRDHCVYDLDGHPSQIALGALLETVTIAATAHGLRPEVARRPGLPDTTPTFDLRFVADPATAADPLIPFITTRATQRRPMRLRRLRAEQRKALEQALPSGFAVDWHAAGRERVRVARLMSQYAQLRLTMPEAYRVHASIIEWKARFSAERVPERALGIDYLTGRVMQWAMVDWKRLTFLNKYLGGTLAPRLTMDFVPGVACAAHVALIAEHPPESIDDYVSAGRAVQRFWLTATQLGLTMQPEMTPLIFGRYAREGRAFTTESRLIDEAGKLEHRARPVIGEEVIERAVWFARIGCGPVAKSRSLRRSLESLRVSPD